MTRNRAKKAVTDLSLRTAFPTPTDPLSSNRVSARKSTEASVGPSKAAQSTVYSSSNVKTQRATSSPYGSPNHEIILRKAAENMPHHEDPSTSSFNSILTPANDEPVADRRRAADDTFTTSKANNNQDCIGTAARATALSNVSFTATISNLQRRLAASRLDGGESDDDVAISAEHDDAVLMDLFARLGI